MQLEGAAFLRHCVTMKLSNPFPFFGRLAAQKKWLYLRKKNAAVIFIRRSKTFYAGMNFFFFFFFCRFVSLRSRRRFWPITNTNIEYESIIGICTGTEAGWPRRKTGWFTGRSVQQRWSYEYFSTIRFQQPASHRPFALLHHDLRLFRIMRHKFWHCCSIRKLQFYA